MKRKPTNFVYNPSQNAPTIIASAAMPMAMPVHTTPSGAINKYTAKNKPAKTDARMPTIIPGTSSSKMDVTIVAAK